MIHIHICCKYFSICIVHQIFFVVQCWIEYMRRLWEQLVCSFLIMICFRIHRWISRYVSGFDKISFIKWFLCRYLLLAMYVRHSLCWNLLCTKVINRYRTPHVAVEHKFNVETTGFLVNITIAIMLDAVIMRGRRRLVHIADQPQRFLAYVH